jgi:hypothetical protein
MKNLPIILFGAFAFSYLVWHLGRWYEYQNLSDSYGQACAEAYLDGHSEGRDSMQDDLVY